MTAEFDVAIVGSGPAGLTAAVELARTGLSVAVLDEFFRPGGRLLGQLYENPTAPLAERRWDGQEMSRQLTEQARDLHVRILSGVTVWSISEAWRLELSGVPEKSLHARTLLLATGAAERALPLPGWTLPGVITVGAAQTFTNLHRVAIGRRVMVVGIDPLALSVALEMHHAGIDVIGVALPPRSPTSGDLSSPAHAVARLAQAADIAPNRLLRTMARLASGGLQSVAVHALRFDLLRVGGVSVAFRKAVTSIEGNGRVESVTLQSVAPDGKPVGSARSVAVDAVCLSAGLYPLTDLAEVAGCPLVDVPELGGLVPLHGPGLQTPADGLFVAGNITGIEGAKVAIAQGRLAAVSIARGLGRPTPMTPEDAAHEVERARATSPFRFLPKVDAGRKAMSRLWQQAQAAKGGLL